MFYYFTLTWSHPQIEQNRTPHFCANTVPGSAVNNRPLRVQCLGGRDDGSALEGVSVRLRCVIQARTISFTNGFDQKEGEERERERRGPEVK
jgi:hypothetical protein